MNYYICRTRLHSHTHTQTPQDLPWSRSHTHTPLDCSSLQAFFLLSPYLFLFPLFLSALNHFGILWNLSNYIYNSLQWYWWRKKNVCWLDMDFRSNFESSYRNGYVYNTALSMIQPTTINILLIECLSVSVNQNWVIFWKGIILDKALSNESNEVVSECI